MLVHLRLASKAPFKQRSTGGPDAYNSIGSSLLSKKVVKFGLPLTTFSGSMYARDALGWSVACDRGICWSYSLKDKSWITEIGVGAIKQIEETFTCYMFEI